MWLEPPDELPRLPQQNTNHVIPHSQYEQGVVHREKLTFGGVAIPQKSHEIPRELLARASYEILLIAMLRRIHE